MIISNYFLCTACRIGQIQYVYQQAKCSVTECSRHKDVHFILVMLEQCIMGVTPDPDCRGVGCVTIWC